MRKTAHIVSINDITSNEYVKSSGEWEPNYITIRKTQVSPVNVMGVVVSAENVIIIDDGTGNINVRVFDGSVPQLEIGDIIMVIGRPREYNDEKYIVPEIIKKLNEDWMELRKKQLEKNSEQKEEVTVEKIDSENNPETIFELIKTLDEGDGADVDKIIAKKGETAEEVIENLLNEGEIFEVKPGRVKVLE